MKPKLVPFHMLIAGMRARHRATRRRELVEQVREILWKAPDELREDPRPEIQALALVLDQAVRELEMTPIQHLEMAAQLLAGPRSPIRGIREMADFHELMAELLEHLDAGRSQWH